MLRNKFVNFLIFMFFIIFVLYLYFGNRVSSILGAKEKKQSIFYWQDGKRKSKLILIPNLIAEFSHKGFHTKSMNSNSSYIIKQIDKQARIKYNFGSVKIWKSGGNTSIAFFKNAHLKTLLKRNSFSPVFKDRSGRLRALPGNIIVRFNKNTGKKIVFNWAKKHSVSIIKIISFYKNVWLVKSSAGFAALTLARKFQNDNIVKYAVPNWWIAVQKK